MNSSATALVSPVHVLTARAGQRFALAVGTIREVLPIPDLEPVPLAPEENLGAFQLRGEIIPAMLPDSLLAIGGHDSPPSVLALLRDGDSAIAVAFDRVLGVLTIDESALVPHPLAAERPWLSHLLIDPRHQLVTVIDGAAFMAAFSSQLRFACSL